MRIRDILHTIAILICGTAISSAQFIINPYAFAAGGGGGGGPTDYSPYLVKQDFEGTGFDNSESWFNGGSFADPDYTAAPLEGSQSLRVNLSAGDANVVRDWGSNETSVTLCMMYYATTNLPDYVPIISIADSAYTSCVTITRESGHLRLESGFAQVTGSASFAAGTLYYIWVEYTKGTGANSICKAYISTTTTRPGTADITITNGPSTYDARLIQIPITNKTCDFVIDHVRVKAGASDTVTAWPL